MNVEYSEQAASDVEAIADYHRSIEAADAGERLIQTIYASFDILNRTPYAGRGQDVPGVRKLVISRTSYIAYYVVDEQAREVIVLSIRHAARKRPYQDN